MMKYLSIISILSLFLFSCEDKIDLDLENGRSQLVIDAFVTNDAGTQTIHLRKSAPYFLNGPTPIATGAKVEIIGPNGVIFPFLEMPNGEYQYQTSSLGALDSIGFNYQLNVSYEGLEVKALSTLNPVPPIDSMTYDFEEEEPGSEEGYYTQFYARDFLGRNDFYWIKAFKNGLPIDTLNPSSFILSQNAAFGGDGADGFVFILPIRAAITNEEEPFILGDVSSVELFSINENVYNYLVQVATQANNDGLFAIPTANIRSTITDLAGNSQSEVLGVFSMASVERSTITIQ